MLARLPKRILNKSAKSIINPTRLLAQMHIVEREKVLEMGLPVGFFATAIAKAVGYGGEIIVAAPNKESLEKLTEQINEHHNIKTTSLASVVSHEAAPEHSRDAIILTNMLSSSTHPDNFCLNLSYYLKPNGRVFLFDWATEQSVGPDQDTRMSRERAITLMTRCGLSLEHILQIPGYHYGLVFSLSGS